MKTMITLVSNKLRNREEGQGMVEYSLILALVSVVAIVTLTTLGTEVMGVFQESADALTGAP